MDPAPAAEHDRFPLEGGPRILPSFPESLAKVAHRNLGEVGVEVRTHSIVTRIEPDAVYVGEERIPTHTVFWAAGNTASALGKSLGVPTDLAGRVLVERDLSIPGHPEVFIAGDMAFVNREGKPPVPGVAPAAIGRSRAIADFGRICFTGRPAWLFWLTLHIMYLVGFRNRLSVLLQWVYGYFTYQRGVRLITNAERQGELVPR